VTPAQLKALLLRLPEHQRANARKRIQFAQDSGWRTVAIWCYEGHAPDIADLVGIEPVDGFDFLPKAPEEK
jgi:hypothetical protein